jgi:hypothetical protein
MIAFIFLALGSWMIVTANVMQNYERQNQVVRLPFFEVAIIVNLVLGIFVACLGTFMIFAGWW